MSKMKIERVCVRRLKTFEYYGNASVELCATLEDTDNLDDVVKTLQIKAEAYVEKQKEITKLEEYKQAVEELLKDVKKLIQQLDEQRKTLETKWQELSNLIGELRDTEQNITQAKNILKKIKEKLKQ